jgi:hypothetical protein
VLLLGIYRYQNEPKAAFSELTVDALADRARRLIGQSWKRQKGKAAVDAIGVYPSTLPDVGPMAEGQIGTHHSPGCSTSRLEA